MIHVLTPIGEFKIVDSKFTEGSKQLESIYTLAMLSPLTPQEGPVDFAIAARMCRYMESWDILDKIYPSPLPYEVN